MVEMVVIRRHTIGRGHGANGADMVVGAFVAHDADGLDGQQDGEGLRADDVARRAERAVADGAAILDVGGYSSRPGADDVTPDEELRRVTLALETIRRRCPDTPVSIDTFRSEVAEGAIERFGPCIVNDITAGTADPAIAAVAARHGVPLIAMHMRGTPQTMQTMTRYDDLTGEVLAYFVEKIGWLRGEGVTPAKSLLYAQVQAALDPYLFPEGAA